MARKQVSKAKPKKKPGKPAAADAAPEGYWRAPVHGYQWPAPGERDGAQLRGALADLDTASPLGEGAPCPALVLYLDAAATAFDVAARKSIELPRARAVRIVDPGFAKFGRLLPPPPMDQARAFAHLIVTLRIVGGRPRFMVDVGNALVLASDYGVGPDAAAASSGAAQGAAPEPNGAAAHS